MKGCICFVKRALLCLVGSSIAASAIFCHHVWMDQNASFAEGGKTALSFVLTAVCFAVVILGSAIIERATKK